MKIRAEKWFITGKMEYTSYKIVSIKKCCDELINSENISLNKAFNEHSCYDYDSSEGDYSVKLTRCEYDDETGYEFLHEKINYCPFCGSRINIEIINTIDKTEEFNTLEKQRDELWNKCCKIDSKKKASELHQQVEALDIKINDMLSSDDFEKGECE